MAEEQRLSTSGVKPVGRFVASRTVLISVLRVAKRIGHFIIQVIAIHLDNFIILKV